MRRVFAVAVIGALLAGCDTGAEPGDPGSAGDPPTRPAPEQAGQRYPDIIDVTVERTGDTYSFTVTISSPYDTPDRYADGWRVLGPDGTVYGEHTLAHDHANEQPFTRTQTGVTIPDEVREVTVEGRDQEYGYGGETVTVSLP